MIRHIVAWNFPSDTSDEEKKVIGEKIKEKIEALIDVIPGIIKIQVLLNPLSSSTRQVVLNSLFENEEALAAYQIHPDHQNVAAFIREHLCERICLDFTDEI